MRVTRSSSARGEDKMRGIFMMFFLGGLIVGGVTGCQSPSSVVQPGNSSSSSTGETGGSSGNVVSPGDLSGPGGLTQPGTNSPEGATTTNQMAPDSVPSGRRDGNPSPSAKRDERGYLTGVSYRAYDPCEEKECPPTPQRKETEEDVRMSSFPLERLKR